VQSALIGISYWTTVSDAVSWRPTASDSNIYNLVFSFCFYFSEKKTQRIPPDPSASDPHHWQMWTETGERELILAVIRSTVIHYSTSDQWIHSKYNQMSNRIMIKSESLWPLHINYFPIPSFFPCHLCIVFFSTDKQPWINWIKTA
jgi:hypothetical protein